MPKSSRESSKKKATTSEAFQLRDNNTIFHSVFDRNSKSSMSCNRNLQPRFSSLAVNCFYKLSSPHIKVNGHVALDRIGGRAGSQNCMDLLKKIGLIT